MSGYGSVSASGKLQKPTDTGELTLTDGKETNNMLWKAFVSTNGKALGFNNTGGNKDKVMSSYGMIGSLQLRHSPLFKQHYLSTITRSIDVPRGHYRRGTPSFEETELLSTMMQKTCTSTLEKLCLERTARSFLSKPPTRVC